MPAMLPFVPGRRPRGGFLLPALLVALLGSAGCQGPQGPAGEDAEDFDHTAPEVRLHQPSAGHLLLGDTLTLAAQARDSAGAVAELRFLLNGAPLGGAEDVRNQGDTLWTMLLDGAQTALPSPYFAVAAEATDTLGNRGRSPARLVHHPRPTGSDTLFYGAVHGRFSPLPVPASLTISGEGDTTDTLLALDRYLMRMTPLGACTLRSAGFYFTSSPGLALPDSVRVLLHAVGEEGLPGRALDSLALPAGAVRFDFWTEVDLAALALEHRLFDRGEEFYLGFTVLPREDDPAVQGLLIGSGYRQAPSPAPDGERAVWHETMVDTADLVPLGYRTLARRDPDHHVDHLFVRAGVRWAADTAAAGGAGSGLHGQSIPEARPFQREQTLTQGSRP